MMFDLLLVGGDVVDGLGSPPYRADVAVKDGRIAAIGELAKAEAARTIRCKGLCISPGWVDIHGHADWTVLDYSLGLNLLIQGCTLTVAGNCGMSTAPVRGRATEMMKRGVVQGYDSQTQRIMFERHPEADWGMGEFLNEVESGCPGVNYVQLVGHAALRRAVMGHDPRPATEQDLKEMMALLEESLEEGAFGMSSGLVFIPACWSDTGELVELCKVVARQGGLYTSHIRGERETNIEAAQEFIEIAEKSGARAHMSHMQSKYPVLGNACMKLEMLEQARGRGVDVSCDSEAFPDVAGTPGQFLQIYHYTPEQLVERLRDPKERAEIKHTMRTIHPWHPLGRFGPGGVPFRRAWDHVVIFDCPHDRSLEGKSVAEVAMGRGVEFEEALFDLALAEGGQGPLFIHDYIEDEHFRTVPWPYCIFPSVDTGLFDPSKALSVADLRHWRETRYPGTIGLFPRVLGQFVRQEKLLSLEKAVRKMTSLATQRLGIADRGVVRPGMWADLTVFDRNTIALRGANPDPLRAESFYPVGIHYVLVNGQVAIEGQTHTGVRAGRVLHSKG
jgi:N-acyl-D-amino-acid deacylase